MVKTHAEMKRRLQAKEKFKMLSSIHEGFEGQVREPNVIQTNAIYSVIADDPEHKVSKMNGGKGCFMQFGKASDWHIENGICECLNKDGARIFSFKFLSDFEEPVDSPQLDFSYLKPKGRAITVEPVARGYAISCELHDAYIYLAKSVDEAVEKYEADRNCVVGDVYNYADGSLLFTAHCEDEFF